MSKTRFVFSIAVVALLVATPAMGQLPGFPVFALSAGDADGATSVGAGYGRGLNDQSGKQNAIGVGVLRAMEQVSFGVFGSYLLGQGAADNEAAFAGAVAYHLPVGADGPVGLSLQTGIGWIKLAETVLNVPVGVVISGSTEAGSMTVTPWVMPRVQFTRVGGTARGGAGRAGAAPEGYALSSTETDFGVSGGVGFSTEGGFGFSLALDWLLEQDILVPADNASRIGFSAAVTYRLQ